MKVKLDLLMKLFLCLFLISGCTLLEVESTKTEQAAPAVEKKEGDQALKSKVEELETRVKALEDKLEGRW